jgi:transposase
MGSALAGTVISDHQRQVLEGCWRAEVAAERGEARPDRVARRRESFKQQIARQLGVSRPTVIVWRARFAEDGPRALSETKPGRGRKPTITAAKIKAVVDSTTQTRPVAQTHLSCRTMAKAQGLSPATVQRIWDAHGLKPHGVKTFKLSTDPRFSERLTAVVGLYLNPPEKAIVFCVDGRQMCAAVVDIAGDVGHRPNRADRALRRRLRRGVPQREGGPPRAKNRARTRRRAAE